MKELLETEDQLLKNENGVQSDGPNNKGQDMPFNFEAFIKNIENIRECEEGLEDDFTTAELYRKIYIEEAISSFYTVSAIVTAIIHYECNKYNDFESLTIFSLCLVSIFNVLFCFSSIVRNYLNFKLRISTQELTNRDRFVDQYNFKYMVAEIILAIFGPNYGFHIIDFTTDISWNLVEVNYDVNHILIVIQIFRIYTFLRFILASTAFGDERAHRVAKMMGQKINSLFNIRCLFYYHPLKLISYTFVISIIALAYMVKILEGPVFKVSKRAQDNLIDFNLMENCLWNILVTMTTVGYGDFYPLTNMGRAVLIMTAFLGSILISLLTIITGSKLTLSDTEQTIFDFSERLDARQDKDLSFKSYALSNLKFRGKYHSLKRYALSNPNFSTDPKYKELEAEVEDLLYEKITLKKEAKVPYL